MIFFIQPRNIGNQNNLQVLNNKAKFQALSRIVKTAHGHLCLWGCGKNTVIVIFLWFSFLDCFQFEGWNTKLKLTGHIHEQHT
jgi:hypothetical protein